MRKSRPKVIDMFAGAGLFSSAFAQEGFEIRQAVELNATAASTYKRNLGNHISAADIKCCSPIGKCDVIIAGPPCQGFSTLGKQDESDKRNFLSLEVVKWAKVANPKIVIIENVSAFLKSAMWQRLSDELSTIGYDIDAKVLNAQDFGVPQIRRRSFTIASKIGFPEIKPIPECQVETVREAWHGLPLSPDEQNHHYSPTPSKLALERMKVVKEGGGKKDIMLSAPELVPPSWWSVPGEVTDVWGRMEWDKPSNTLRTCFQNPSKGRYIHPERNRVISLREGARLHTINDDWTFCGLPTQIARQIGNSVPINLGRAVARSVRDLF